jgi:methionyl aminopeptidase
LLEDGDIINIDVTVYLDGVHGDCSETFPVDNVVCTRESWYCDQLTSLQDVHGLHLIDASRRSLDAGLSACGPGLPFKGIGAAISSVAKELGCSVSSVACGPGIGRSPLDLTSR